MLVLIAVIR